MGVITIPIPRPGHLIGMDRTGQSTFNLGANSTPVKIPGWAIRTGFTAFTVISNDSMRLDGPAVLTINFRGQFNAAAGTQSFMAYVNGAQVGTVGNATAGTVPNFVFKGGDILELYGSSSLTATRTVTAGNTTYLYLG